MPSLPASYFNPHNSGFLIKLFFKVHSCLEKPKLIQSLTVKNEVLQLQNFDELCESAKATEKWGALLELMQRPWFSRRWVVQEIALARKAVVYCGGDMLSWKKFAVAVELFVEVETATHRLSEVMKMDPKFYHVPGWFEYVSALGASLLVEATGKLFRDYKPNEDPNLFAQAEFNSDSDSDSDFNADSEENTDAESDSGDSVDSDIEPDGALILNSTELNRVQPLLSLEYLVSSLSIFEATVPHDTIYALLAIAKDTTPSAADEDAHLLLDQTKNLLEVFTEKKSYRVEYGQPFVDVCKDFVQFCIEQGSDQTRALDVICRPWAPEPQKNKTKRRPSPAQRKETGGMNGTNITAVPQRPEQGSNGTSSQPEVPWRPRKKVRDNMPMPSWIPKLSGAAYAMYSQAGVHELKMGRQNADTLVGLPPSFSSLERNYNAAQTKVLDRKTLNFRRRSKMRHYSMYVKGFVLDTIFEVFPSSQGGAIPREWAKAAGWRHAPYDDPPDDFWRTLVADRGRDGKNPPVYYSRACKESFFKGSLQSGRVDTTDLINNERCSVVAQFCRRVQAVIWNRSLIKTAATRRLGLANQNALKDDLVCILYGCSAPVILRHKLKDEEAGDIDQEVDEDVEHWRIELASRLAKTFRRTKNFKRRREEEKIKYAQWDNKMREKWENDDQWRRQKLEELGSEVESQQPSKAQINTASSPHQGGSPGGDRSYFENSVPFQTSSNGQSTGAPNLPSELLLIEFDPEPSTQSSEADLSPVSRQSPNPNDPPSKADPQSKANREAPSTKIGEDHLSRQNEVLLEQMEVERIQDKDYKAWKRMKREAAKKAEREREERRLEEDKRKEAELKEAVRKDAKRKSSRRKEPGQGEPDQTAQKIVPPQANTTLNDEIMWDEPRVNWRKFELRLKYGRRWKRLARMRKAVSRNLGEILVIGYLRRREEDRRLKLQAKLKETLVEPATPIPNRQTTTDDPSSSNGDILEVSNTQVSSTINKVDTEIGITPPVPFKPMAESKEKSRAKTFSTLSSKKDWNITNGTIPPRVSFDLPADPKGKSREAAGPYDSSRPKSVSSSKESTAHGILLTCAPDPSKPPSDAYVGPLRTKLKEKYFKKDEDVEMAAEEMRLGRELLDGERDDLKKRVDDHNKRVPDNRSFYEFLGECYIHGMMDGEAMGYQNEKSIPAQVFELR